MPVKIFGYGQGSVETTLFLASANADSSGVDKAVLATPSYIYADNGYITAGLISDPEPDRRLRNLKSTDIAEDGQERTGRTYRRRALKKGKKSKKSKSSKKSSKKSKSPEDNAPTNDGDSKYSSYLRHRGGSKSSHSSSSSDSCDDSKDDLKYRKREIREALSYWDYKEFYKIFRTLAKNFKYETGLDYNCDYNWEDLINEALCQVDNTFDVCQPARQSEWETFLADMAANDIYSLYGPDFVNQIDTYCEDTKIMNPLYDSECAEEVCEPEYLFTEQCEFFRSLYPEGDEVYNEIGLRYLDQLIQNTFNGSFC